LNTCQVLHGKEGVDPKRYLLMRDEKLGKLKLNTLVVKGMQFSRAGKAGINFSTQLMEAPTDPETGKVKGCLHKRPSVEVVNSWQEQS
jgi:hypothetical protein